MSQKKISDLKILHIGNIANNAYNNAKILNKYCINDVLSPDYFHVIGCPEWEELDIQPHELNDFDPEWYKVNQNFKRPYWFAQGYLTDCLEYLIAKNKKNIKKQKHFWRLLEYTSKLRKKDSYYYYLKFKLKIKKRVIRYLELQYRRVLKVGRILKLVPPPVKIELPNYSDLLIKEFEFHFPNRKDKLSKQDFSAYPYTQLLNDTFEFYDLVFCYGASTILPIIVGHNNFVGYEHGTLREIPWADNTLARLTALSYVKARSILMTNADSVPHATKLNSKLYFGQHGFLITESQAKIKKYKDVSIIKDYLKINVTKSIKILQSTRQDWETKGNNKFLEALARLKAEGFNDFEVILVNWGRDVQLAKDYITKHELEGHVHWIPALSKPQLLKLYTEVDILIDQFNIPCIGSTPLEIFSVKGAALLTSLNDEMLTKFYGRTIPLLNCKTADEIHSKLRCIFNKEINLDDIKEQCYKWLIETHSEEKIAKTLLLSQGLNI